MDGNSIRCVAIGNLDVPPYTGKRVGVLLMKNLSDALRSGELASTESKLWWLAPEQFIERNGRLRLLPGTSTQIVAFARTNHLHVLGVVIVDENGRRTDLLIEKEITPEYHDSARQLLRWHVSFWLCDENGTRDCGKGC